VGGQVFEKPADMPIEKVAYAFQAAQPEKPSYIARVNPTTVEDKFSTIGTIEIVQFGKD